MILMSNQTCHFSLIQSVSFIGSIEELCHQVLQSNVGCCSYFLGHAPPHHWGRGRPGSPSVSLGPSPPAEIIKTKPLVRSSNRPQESGMTIQESSEPICEMIQ